MDVNLKPKTLGEAKELYLAAKKAYFEGNPIMSDERFDALERKLKERCPNWKPIEATGIKIGKKRQVQLPRFLPSLAKRYTDIGAWFDKYPLWQWLYMAKLDGCSVLLEYQNGVASRLITRGDGEIGQDISFFLPHLQTIPTSIEIKDRIFFRCEALLTREVYESRWSSEFDNARNMVAGLFNRHELHPAVADIHLVVLGVFDRPCYDGLCLAFRLGFETVYNRLDAPNKAQQYYHTVRAGKYEADGVVIADPNWIYFYDSAEKPKQSIVAYKENTETAETTVLEIVYQTSSAGRLTPKIRVEPVTLAGATINYCTAHNAQWMLDRGLGIGSKINLCRSGDVIPKIIDVITKGKIVLPDCEYKKVGVHFVQTRIGKEQTVSLFSKVFSALDIDGVRDKTLGALYDNGVTDLSILVAKANDMDYESWLVQHFGQVKGKQVFNALQRLVTTSWPIARLITAISVEEGVGLKRLTQLQETDFDLLKLSSWPEQEIVNAIQGPGIGEHLASTLAHGLTAFHEFWENNSKYFATPTGREQRHAGPLTGMHFAWTGYRSKDEEETITSLGGTVGSFTNKTNWLFYRSDGKQSSKVAKAGTRAISFSTFIDRFKSVG